MDYAAAILKTGVNPGHLGFYRDRIDAESDGLPIAPGEVFTVISDKFADGHSHYVDFAGAKER